MSLKTKEKTKTDKQFERRIELMRQITKIDSQVPDIVQEDVFLLLDIETDYCYGIFSDHDLCYTAMETIWDKYDIETYIRVNTLNEIDSVYD